MSMNGGMPMATAAMPHHAMAIKFAELDGLLLAFVMLHPTVE
jgi:hypothetical protein